MTHPPPVIVIAGITGTSLCDAYRMPPETIWSVSTKGYESSTLHPDNLRFEVAEPARTVNRRVPNSLRTQG